MLRSRELELEYMARNMSPGSIIVSLYYRPLLYEVFTVENMNQNFSLLGVGGDTLVVA